MIHYGPQSDCTLDYRPHPRDPFWRLQLVPCGIARPHPRDCTCIDCSDPSYREMVQAWDLWRAERERRARASE